MYDSSVLANVINPSNLLAPIHGHNVLVLEKIEQDCEELKK